MPEIWELLDEKGESTEKTMQKGEEVPEGFYHPGADVWILNSENKIFIQKRSPKKRLSPNVWAMTGGSTIQGETSLQTIARETLEELGVKLNLDKVEFVKRFKEGNVFIDTYFVRQNIDLNDVVMQEDEVCDVKWATFEKIEELVQKDQFIHGRWGYVRDLIKEVVEKDESCNH